MNDVLRRLLLAAVAVSPTIAVVCLPITVALLVSPDNVLIHAAGVITGIGWLGALVAALKRILREQAAADQAAAEQDADTTQES
ncbi:hypothetical protein ACGFJC_47025 [Nonomuraea fuscirosea]|uniref:hypothetical protein n=1 Tax=Nonomuraea fuscirosea TaxID=1291556 RepID=UPI0037195E8A